MRFASSVLASLAATRLLGRRVTPATDEAEPMPSAGDEAKPTDATLRPGGERSGAGHD